MIRRATEDDVSAIAWIAENAYAGYVAELGKKPAPMVADFRKHVTDDWVIVFDQPPILGYAVILERDRPILLDNIAVDISAQKRGIGKALMDAIDQHLLDLGLQYYDLYTNVVMTANISWYQKLGFTETRRVREKGFERVYMRKYLSQSPA